MNRLLYLLILSTLIFSCRHPLDVSDQNENPGSKPLQSETYGNHHLHNFHTTEEMARHALAMGYQHICHEKPDGSEYKDLGLITTHNARVGPVRIYVNKQTGKIMIEYHQRYLLPSGNKSAIAARYGMEREAGRLYPLNDKDWFIIRNYSATTRPADSLYAEEVTESTFTHYFRKTWPLEDETYRSFNLGANWKSKKVVNDLVKYLKAQEDWHHFDALFLDGINNIDVADPVNMDFGGIGHYQSAREGQLDFMIRLTNYLRDPGNTGRETPVLIFGNIWDPKGKGAEDILRAYGEGNLRLDHYYFEKGGTGSQAPNGVVPGTEEPAYVVPGEPGAYLPASRVALDDVYGFNKNMNVYNRRDHFLQHLDACGTAGLYGAWFGWYGEDGVTRKDDQGNLIYTNDLQLLRAIPNWDNIHKIPVPAFNRISPSDQRSWHDNVYESVNSYASESVIFSRNPFNKELYIVFRNQNAKIDLGGREIASAWLTNDWFRKEDKIDPDALMVKKGQLMLSPETADQYIMRGIRITLKEAK